LINFFEDMTMTRNRVKK